MNPVLPSVFGLLEGGLEPGDRVEAAVHAQENRLLLPQIVWAEGSVESIEDQEGRPLKFTADPCSHRLLLPALKKILPDNWATVWLEQVAPGRFRLAVETAPVAAAEEPLTAEQGVPAGPDPADFALLRGDGAACATLADSRLALRAAGLSTHAGFDRLICLPLVRDMELLEHQIRTAKTVLQRFRGRALLCDEVGLGKTIEAGLVFDELLLRGLVRSALVLTPPSLIEQWQGEMRRKFSLDLISHDDPAFRQRGADAWQRVRPGHRLDPHGQARAAPLGHPRPQVGPGHRRRGPPPAQPQHAGLAVRQRDCRSSTSCC